METRRSYHHGDLKAALLERSLLALEARGVADLSLREVAQELGVSKNAPYRHFPDKQTLLMELAAEGFGRLANALEAISPLTVEGKAVALERLRNLIAAYIAFARHSPRLYGLMFSRLGYGLHSERCKINADRAMGCLIGAVSTAQAAGWQAGVELTPLALQLWALAHGWAGLYSENLIPPELPGSEADWPSGLDALLGIVPGS